MQLGIRLHDTKNLPLEERLIEVNKQGFSCVHLALSKVIRENSVAPEALTPGYAMFLKRLFSEKRLDIAVLGCYLNLANPDPDKLKEITEKYKAHIRFASLLGCGVVGTETGAPNAEYKYEPACHSEEALELFIRNLRPVVEYAEKMGVIFAIVLSLQQGWHKTVFFSLGQAIGISILFTAAMSGMGVVLANSPTLFNAIKIAGAFFILYLVSPTLWAILIFYVYFFSTITTFFCFYVFCLI